MRELTIVLLFVLAYVLYLTVIRKYLFLVKVTTKNGKGFLVRNLKDNQKAADILSNLSDQLLKLSTYCKDHPEEPQKMDMINTLVDNFDPLHIIETIPGSSHVAYSVNKGDELSICIREEHTEKFMDMNTIIFVSIHELAHIMTPETGHTPLFWDNMKYLLEQAIKIDIYTPVNYELEPVVYCGMVIDSTPLVFDKK